MTTQASGAIERTNTFGNYLIHGIDEIILPDAVSWWPSGPGWQVLGMIGALLLLLQTFKVAHKWRHNRYRREALRQLRRVQQSNREPGDVVAVLPFYLKVTALKAYPRQDVASLSGNEWLAFLDAHYPGPAFSTGIGRKLISIAYQPVEEWRLDDAECESLIKMSRHWIAKHREAINA